VDALAAAGAGREVTGRRLALGTVALSLAAGGCYQARPLDARSVMSEVAAEPLPRGARGGSPNAGPAPGALSESDAVTLALKSNPDLRAARQQKGIAEGEIITAGSLNNPTVDLDFIHLTDYGTKNAWAIGLGWEPPQPGVYGAMKAAARAGAAAVDADVAEAEWQLSIAVRAAHAELVALTEKRALADKALEGRRQIATLVDKRVNGGASTRIDLSLAQLAVADIERVRDDLAGQEIAAATALGLLMGTAPPAGATGTLSDDASAPAALEPLVESALASRPGLVAAEKRYLQREETVRAERARRWPWFRFTAAPRYRTDASEAYPYDFAAGLRITVPLLNQNQGAIQVAEATRDQERELFRKQVVGLRRDLENARAVITLRSTTLRRYQTQVLPSLEAQERLLAIATSGGQLDVVAVLRAADEILKSRGEYVDIKLDCYRGRLDLERAIGPRAR
jgi:outer membrane protein TolC